MWRLLWPWLESGRAAGQWANARRRTDVAIAQWRAAAGGGVGGAGGGGARGAEGSVWR